MSNWRTHAGISINLPEISVWRVKLKITIVITTAAAMQAQDGVLITAVTESVNLTLGNPLTVPFDQPYMLYDGLFLGKSAQLVANGLPAAGTFVLYSEYDIKAHRRLQAQDDTLFLTFSSMGQAQMTQCSIQQSTLLRLK